MLYAVLTLAVTALGFAGTAVALALRISGLKDEKSLLTQKARALAVELDGLKTEFERANKLIEARRKLLGERDAEIQKLHDLLRHSGADGVAASLFDKLLQEADPSADDR